MEALEMQLARLATLSSAALRAEWRQLHKAPAPDLSADLLRRGVASKLQEKALGGLPASIRREIERLMRELARTGEAVAKPAVAIKTGTWLVRDWGGESHHVLVLDDGYLYRDQRYRSLSVIATAITGARWSGPRFFGVQQRSGKPADA